MSLQYAFRVTTPAERLSVAIQAADAGGPVLMAQFAARRRPLTDAGLLAAWAAHPLVTLKVIAAIHVEAIKLLAKGLRLRAGPPAPKDPVSLGASEIGPKGRAPGAALHPSGAPNV
jgi:DUF1365 family protein